MKRLLIGLVALFLLTASAPSNTYEAITQMLAPVVQLNTADRPVGSGTSIYYDGTYSYIITAKHVTDYSVDARNIAYTTYDNYGAPLEITHLPYEEVYTSPTVDLSLIRVEAKLPVASLGFTSAVSTESYTVGGGFGMPIFMTKGIISALFEDKIQHSSEAAPGNSGGGLFIWDKTDKRYELVGVVDMVYTKALTSVLSKYVRTEVHYIALSLQYKDFLDEAGFADIYRLRSARVNSVPDR